VGGATVVWDDRISIYHKVERFEGLLLKSLFVDPKAQRKRIATEIVAEFINILHDQGRRNQLLWSSYILGNETSEAWHRKFGGFETDFDYDRHKRLIGLL
jgi:GNAT superfamily N-acetyltransferase